VPTTFHAHDDGPSGNPTDEQLREIAGSITTDEGAIFSAYTEVVSDETLPPLPDKPHAPLVPKKAHRPRTRLQTTLTKFAGPGNAVHVLNYNPNRIALYVHYEGLLVIAGDVGLLNMVADLPLMTATQGFISGPLPHNGDLWADGYGVAASQLSLIEVIEMDD